jgi:hypothetical protein
MGPRKRVSYLLPPLLNFNDDSSTLGDLGTGRYSIANAFASIGKFVFATGDEEMRLETAAASLEGLPR